VSAKPEPRTASGSGPVEDPERLAYVLRLADTALVNGQRLAEWCGHAPSPEEDLALANIGLDFIGRARLMYQYAGRLEGAGRGEDDFAMLRTEAEYRNFLIVELPNRDFGFTIARQYLVDEFECLFFERLLDSNDDDLVGAAEKSIKEARYHLRHSAEWMRMLGDGTDESHARIAAALVDAWRYTDDLFAADHLDAVAVEAGYGVDVAALKPAWEQRVAATLADATLTVPEDVPQITGGRAGLHTEHMGYLLAELQIMQRTYPNLSW